MGETIDKKNIKKKV